MNIEVRKALQSDSRRIAEIHVAAWRAAYVDVMDSGFLSSLCVSEREEMWIKALSGHGRGSYLVGLIHNVVCGFCVYGPARDKKLDATAAELVALNVEPEHWGKGIGGSLVCETVDDLKSGNYNTVHLWVACGNERAIRLYERKGFVSSGVQKTDNTDSDNPIIELRYDATLG